MFETAKTEKKEEHLAGIVERVTFHNQENGFCVLKLKVKGSRDLVTVVGVLQQITAGEILQAKGYWQRDHEYGLQFRTQDAKVLPPTTKEGIEKYLASGAVRGIGEHFAKKLVAIFGEKIFEIIEKKPKELLKIAGIGPKKAEKIVKSWCEQKKVREILLFLHSHGVTSAKAERIYKTYGEEAVEKITDNPYLLARDIRGIGFKSADKIAENLGVDKQSIQRACAGVTYVLQEAMSNGHCGLPQVELVEQAIKMLEIDETIIKEAIKRELTEGSITEDLLEEEKCVFLSGLYRAEQMIAKMLLDLQKGALPWGKVEQEKALLWLEKESGLTFPESQKKALETVLCNKLTVITGGPGVGKTTLINALLKILHKKKLKIALCAPTGRAAKRMNESTGMEAKTIHRLLEYNPQGGFKKGEFDLLDIDLIVVDEFSMVDIPILYSLLKAIPKKAAMVIVGDVDQLPSVGPGQVLKDIIESNVLKVMRLTEVFRQAKESRIIRSAHEINLGELPKLPEKGEKSDFFFIKAETPEDCLNKILKVVMERIPHTFKLDAINDVQVLCPMNRGGVGTSSLNSALQQALNKDAYPRVERFGTAFCLGDKVMQVENNYDKEVYNGDIGKIVSIDQDDKEMVIEFDGRKVLYEFADLDSIVLAYACTVHKSQGSEYPAVVIPMMTQHYQMLKKNLLYTGVTRGKKLVVIVGQWKALAMAVKGRHKTEKRWSKLREWLSAKQK